MNQLNSDKLFKGKYLIAFYGADDETPIVVFNNIKEIMEYRGEEINQRNYTFLKVHLYKALKRESHSTRMLDGTPMRVYLIDMEDEEDL